MRQVNKPHKMSRIPAYYKYKHYPKCAGVNHMFVFLRTWGVEV